MNGDNYQLMQESIINEGCYKSRQPMTMYRQNDYFNPTVNSESNELHFAAFCNNNNNSIFPPFKDTLDQIDDENLFDNNLSQVQFRAMNSFTHRSNKEEEKINEQENKDMERNVQDIQLNPFRLVDFQEPGVVFDPPSFQDSANSSKLQDQSKRIHRKQELKKDYDKNICRYMARMVVRCFVNVQYKV